MPQKYGTIFQLASNKWKDALYTINNSKIVRLVNSLVSQQVVQDDEKMP